MTFTSAKHIWVPLCNALQETRNISPSKYTITNYAETIESLIRKHLVTCNRYYKHIITTFHQLISSNNELFGNLEDYFFITEF